MVSSMLLRLLNFRLAVLSSLVMSTTVRSFVFLFPPLHGPAHTFSGK